MTDMEAHDYKRIFEYKSLYKEHIKLKGKYASLQLEHNRTILMRETSIKKEVEIRTKELSDEVKEKDKEILALKKEIAKLTSKLDNNSINSSLPTSKTKIGTKKFIPNTREKTGKLKGGQQGHKKHKLSRFTDEEITEEVKVVPSICNNCQSSNIEILTGSIDKDETDYEVKVVKRRYRFMECLCKDCGHKFHKPIPNNLKEDNQYGFNLQSLAVCLTNEIYTPFNKTVKLISGITDGEINMSEGYVVKLQKKACNFLDNFIQELREFIPKQPVYGWDDGVIDINTNNGILRVYCTDKVTLFEGHEKKDINSLDEDGILLSTSSTTVVMHDHITHNYNDKYAYQNVECMIHLIRRLNKMEDNTHHSWCIELKDLLSQSNKDRNMALKSNKDSFDSKYLTSLSSNYDIIIKKGYFQNEEDSNNYFFEEEISFLNDLKKYKNNYLLWAYRFDLPSTNNNCERSIRPVKSKMKISGHFQSIEYAKYYAYIRSYIETCKRNGLNILDACSRLMSGTPYSLTEILDFSNEKSD